MRNNTPEKLRLKIQILATAAFLLIVYTILHEFGHGVIGLICGGEITEFVIGPNAHICIRGANYNNFTAPLGHAFGPFLPFIAFTIFIGFYNSKIKNSFYQLFNFLSVVGISFSLVSWIVIPVLYALGIAPKGDDVTKFMQSSGVPFLPVSLVSSILIAAFLFFAFKVKKIHLVYYSVLKKGRSKS